MERRGNLEVRWPRLSRTVHNYRFSLARNFVIPAPPTEFRPIPRIGREKLRVIPRLSALYATDLLR